MQAQQTAPQVETGAQFPERLVAYIIDAVVIGVPFVILMALLPMGLAYLIGLIGSVGYVIYSWTATGQTIGKMAMGLRVVNADTGDLITPGSAAMRYVGYIVSGMAFYLGFLWIIWDPKREGWHDKIARTRVVKAR